MRRRLLVAAWLLPAIVGGASVANAELPPYSLDGASNGVSANAAQTVDVGNSINAVVEHSRLIDANGVTACDKYFGWGGRRKVQTEAQKILCGKYQFLYEHWSTVGMPKALLEFNEKWFPEFFGNEYEHLGYFPNSNPKRVVTDIQPIAAGQCMETARQCGWERVGFIYVWRCKDVCVRTAPENTWREVYTIVADDQLPVGFQLSPKKTFGFESAAFTCAGCHLSQLPDGRYAVGMANQNLNYGQVLSGFATPMQGSLVALMNMLDEPLVGDALDALLSLFPDLPDFGALLDMMKMHPGMMFNNPSTQVGFTGSAYKNMMADLKIGTCYRRGNGALIRCDHNNAVLGPQKNRDKAAKMLALLQSKYGTVITEPWTMTMSEIFGDAYCVPWPLWPSACNDPQLDCGQYLLSLSPSLTLASMRDNCNGVRWNSEYWSDFTNTMLAMVTGDLGSLAFPTMSEQDMLINAGFNVLDFLEKPMSDDQVWTLSKIANVVGIADQATVSAHPGMRTAGGQTTQMLALSAAGRSLEQFASAFVLLSGSVDPRYVECTTPGIVGNWSASPDASCRVKAAMVAPLVAYMESLKTPYIAGSVTPAVTRGKALFEQHCVGCHDGPSGESTGVFMFADGLEELMTPDLCAPGQRPVEWTATVPPQPIYNECRPTYSELGPNPDLNDPRVDIARYIGFIGTDPTYSRFAQPDTTTGLAGVNPELQSLGKVSQGVKAQRLTGVRYKWELLHHGQINTLGELLCAAGTKRATPADRAAEECMVYDLGTPASYSQYKSSNGQNGVCLQTWRPFQGHEAGCDLDASDKADLIEYLNTL